MEQDPMNEAKVPALTVQGPSRFSPDFKDITFKIPRSRLSPEEIRMREGIFSFSKAPEKEEQRIPSTLCSGAAKSGILGSCPQPSVFVEECADRSGGGRPVKIPETVRGLS